MSNSIQIEIDGQKYSGFTNVVVTLANVDSISGQFDFTTTFSENLDFPIKRGSSCVIYVNDTPVVTGYVEVIEISYDASGNSISAKGRDVTADVIDSTLPGDIVLNNGAELEDIIRAVLDSLNLQSVGIISTVDIEPFDDGEMSASSETTQNAFSLIMEHAKAKEVLLTTDGLGNIVIQRASTVAVNNGILNIQGDDASNIIRARLSLDDTQRFHDYVCRSQDSIDYSKALFEDFDGFINVESSAVDEQVRDSRRLEFFSETTLDGGGAEQRSIWEANVRKGKAFQYSVTVQDFTYDGTNIWRPNLLIPVVDNFTNINSELLLNSVSFSSDSSSGTMANLDFVDPNTYQLSIERTRQEILSESLADEFVID